jgi:molybdopterin-guanine dinucleotide biosynthesis adapter protein
MPPVVCVVGHHNSGKTTLVEKLLAELSSRGYQVASVKHATEIDIDRPGTDSRRHQQAGSKAVVLATTQHIVLMQNPPTPPTIADLIRLIGEDYDLVIVEGYKGESAPKIEVQRNKTGPLLSGLKSLIAVVTDEEVETTARKFSWSDIKGLANLIEEGFIKPNPEHLSVYIDGSPIALSSFPREFISNMMVAMASSLKGIKGANSLEFRLRRS